MSVSSVTWKNLKRLRGELYCLRQNPALRNFTREFLYAKQRVFQQRCFALYCRNAFFVIQYECFLMNFLNYAQWNIAPNDFWKQKGFSGQMKFLIRFGILAPSSHNTQPWSFKIGEHGMDVFADFSRHLRYSD